MNIDPNLPVDKTAAIVVSKSDEHGIEFRCGHNISSMTRLPTRSWPNKKEDDLTGRTSGRFTVIGYALWKPKNWRTSSNSVRWVVRCTCGRYQMLTTKAVKNNSPYNMCEECYRINNLKRFGKPKQQG
jgi:hypothetical protein